MLDNNDLIFAICHVALPSFLQILHMKLSHLHQHLMHLLKFEEVYPGFLLLKLTLSHLMKSGHHHPTML